MASYNGYLNGNPNATQPGYAAMCGANGCTVVCAGQCSGGCKGSCKDDCSVGCNNQCSANNCRGGCSAGHCGTACADSCGTDCAIQCGYQCSANNCRGSCSGGHCGVGCANSCTSNCGEDGCSVQCSGPCKGTCQGGCGGCDNSCSSCTGSCSGGCQNGCKGKCQGTCKDQCNNQCKDNVTKNLSTFQINDLNKMEQEEITFIINAIKYEVTRRKETPIEISIEVGESITSEKITSLIENLKKANSATNITLAASTNKHALKTEIDAILTDLKTAWDEIIDPDL